MTRALISDDSIARQINAGPVQLGYVPIYIDFLFNYTFNLFKTILNNMCQLKSKNENTIKVLT